MSCTCALSRMAKGSIVVVHEEEHMGLFVYTGESHHSTSYRHTVRLRRYNEPDDSWHIHCGIVYVPNTGNMFWPYSFLVDPGAHL